MSQPKITPAVANAYLAIVRAGYLEDRAEYTPEDFRRESPELTAEEAETLYGVVQSGEPWNYIDASEVALGKQPIAEALGDLRIGAALFHKYLTETIEDSAREGWDDRDQLTIQALIRDMALYFRNLGI